MRSTPPSTATPMNAASAELERRSQYLSSLIQRTKITSSMPSAVPQNPVPEPPRAEEKDGEKDDEKGKKGFGDGDGDIEADVMQNVRVRAADMSPALQHRAFRCARKVLDGMPKLDSKRLALALKKEFDASYGPAWHCIVGKSFGSYVTHSLGGFLYFSIDKVYILLFRTAVEPLGH